MAIDRYMSWQKKGQTFMGVCVFFVIFRETDYSIVKVEKS